MLSLKNQPEMTAKEVQKFRKEMARRMRGDLTPKEKTVLDIRNREIECSKEKILARHGGKNPILGY